MTWALPGTYTKLSTYEKCPAQAGYRWKQRLSTPKSPQAARGTDAHQTAEDYLNGKTHTLHEAVVPYKHVLDHVKANDPFVEIEVAVDKEWKLTAWDGSHFRLKLDSAYVYGNRVEIQEWKTGKMYDDHADQRRLYLLGSMAKWPAANEYQIQSYYFDLGTKKKLLMTKEEIQDVKRDFTTRIHIMATDDILAPRPGYYCSWCGYSKYKGGPCRSG